MLNVIRVGSLVAVLLLSLGRAGAEVASAAMFDPTALRDVRVTMDPADWQRIVDFPESSTVYPCAFEWNGERLPDVGVRPKGQASRESGTKPSIRFRFNHYVSQTFRGLTRLDANALKGDPSMMRERLIYDTARRAGMIAPRWMHVRMFVNGIYIGLYGILDQYDQAEVLRLLFPDHRGNLYKCTWTHGRRGGDVLEWVGDDPILYVGPTGPFDWQRRRTETPDDLMSLLDAINNTSEEDFRSRLPGLLDMDAFLAYCALQEVVAQEDWMLSDITDFGQPLRRGGPSSNNWYFYSEPSMGRMYVMIWDVDAAMYEDWAVESWVVRDLYVGFDQHVLGRRVMAVPEWRRAFQDKVRSLVGSAFAPGVVVADLDLIRAQIDEAARQDPMRPYSYEDFRREGDRLRAQVPLRVQNVIEQLGR